MTLTREEIAPFRNERSVITALTRLGHEVRVLGGMGDLTHIRDVISEWHPDVAVNLMEEFGGEGDLRALRARVSRAHAGCRSRGCNPSGLMMADDKELMKKLLRYHRIPAPDFAVFPRGRRVHPPAPIWTFPSSSSPPPAHGSGGHRPGIPGDERRRNWPSALSSYTSTCRPTPWPSNT